MGMYPGSISRKQGILSRYNNILLVKDKHASWLVEMTAASTKERFACSIDGALLQDFPQVFVDRPVYTAADMIGYLTVNPFAT